MWNLKTFFRSKTLKEKDHPHLCLYPFFNVMVTANGMYKPCCKWNDHLKADSGYLQTPSHSLQDAFESEEMKKLRNDFLQGRKHPACSVCWNEESLGIKSMRSDSFGYQLDESVLKEEQLPKRMDLYLNNTCNLKCRICSPTYSSKWIQEAMDTMGEHETVHNNFTDVNFEYIKSCIPGVVELGLFGGEPLYIKETELLLQYCVDNGYSKNIQLLINTNGSVYAEKWMTLFKSFKKVLLNFSLDDFGERFEYQRKGAKWENVNKNIRQFIKQSTSTIECKICCTVSSLNIFYLPEILQQFNDEFPQMDIYLNFLHGPYALSIRNLPNEVKLILQQKLSISANQKNSKNADNRNMNDVLEFISLDPNVSFQEFFKEIKRGDNYRKEDFGKVFPEFWEIIQSYKA